MTRTIEFYFDFASPYAYFSLAGLQALEAAQGCTVAWRPILLWAVRQRFEMTPPMEDGAKGGYLPLDMARSAAFHGVPFVMPESFGRSTHLAARFFYGLAGERPEAALGFAQAVFGAHFADSANIADAAVLVEIGSRLGLAPAESTEMMQGQASRDALARAVETAVERRVWGSPFFILGDEPFFGADRLPQLEWRLVGAA